MISMKKQITRQKKKQKTIQDELLSFGQELKEWNGDLEKIGEPFKSVLKSSISTFKETKDPCHLLLSFMLQNIVAYIMSKSVMSSMFFKAKTEYEFPKKTISQLGDMLISLSEDITLPALLSILVFAYQNDLIQTAPI